MKKSNNIKLTLTILSFFITKDLHSSSSESTRSKWNTSPQLSEGHAQILVSSYALKLAEHTPLEKETYANYVTIKFLYLLQKRYKGFTKKLNENTSLTAEEKQAKYAQYRSRQEVKIREFQETLVDTFNSSLAQNEHLLRANVDLTQVVFGTIPACFRYLIVETSEIITPPSPVYQAVRNSDGTMTKVPLAILRRTSADRTRYTDQWIFKFPESSKTTPRVNS